MNSRGPKAAKRTIEFLYRPGTTLDDVARRRLVGELRDTASTCFAEVPIYQALRGEQRDLEEAVISIARNEDGSMAGFCSSLLLPVDGVGEVLHFGLTCVRPEHRRGGLTHTLVSTVARNYLLRYHPFSRVWFSSLACVVSSLGSVALNFDDVYPSPFGRTRPSARHIRIARAIDETCRERAFINKSAEFDAEHFVFRGSVGGTVFQKDAANGLEHRDRVASDFYHGLMSFEDGDEVLQVGSYSVLTTVNYYFGPRRFRRVQAAVRRYRESSQRERPDRRRASGA